VNVCVEEIDGVDEVTIGPAKTATGTPALPPRTTNAA
jgi:hypothetical protein